MSFDFIVVEHRFHQRLAVPRPPNVHFVANVLFGRPRVHETPVRLQVISVHVSVGLYTAQP